MKNVRNTEVLKKPRMSSLAKLRTFQYFMAHIFFVYSAFHSSDFTTSDNRMTMGKEFTRCERNESSTLFSQCSLGKLLQQIIGVTFDLLKAKLEIRRGNEAN
jgi:hypothetical protein